MPFIAIQCPSCSSTDVTLRGGGNYECNHCGTVFLRKDQPQAPPPRPPAPPPPAPPPQLSVPVNHYGPQPTVAPQPVQVQVQPARFRWGLWLFIMMFAFGGPLIGGLVTFLQASDATEAALAAGRAATKTVTSPPPTPSVVVDRKPRINMGSAAKNEEDDKGDANAEPVADPTPTAGEDVSLDQFQRLKGCSCSTDAGNVDLYTRHDGGGTTITGSGTTRTMNLSFALKAGNKSPFALPLTPDTAPASRFEQGRFPIGVGCGDDTVVIATGRKLTGWSLDDRTERWTTDLPQSYGDVKPSDKPSVDCKSLTVRNGVASVRVGSKTVKVDVATGKTPKAESSSAKPSPDVPTEPPKPEPKPEPEPEPEAKPKPEPKPAPEPKPEPASDGKKKKKKKKGKKKKGKKKK